MIQVPAVLGDLIIGVGKKARVIDQRDHVHRSPYLRRRKLLRETQKRFGSHIFPAVNARGYEDRFSFLRAGDHGHREPVLCARNVDHLLCYLISLICEHLLSSHEAASSSALPLLASTSS